MGRRGFGSRWQTAGSCRPSPWRAGWRRRAHRPRRPAPRLRAAGTASDGQPPRACPTRRACSPARTRGAVH
eukprot:782101-Prymnesium_polylepis.1